MPDVIINGPEGRIEARYFRNKNPKAPLVVVLHPHPEHGGTMNNKVTYAMYRAFADYGFTVIRFNFRGVGKSEGFFDNGEGELSDATSVLDWIQEQHPEASGYWVAGFSFGALIGMQLLMRRPELNGFVSVSPPANNFDFSFLAPCPVSGLIVQGDRDEIVPKEAVDELVGRLNQQKGIEIDYHLIQGAGHFFEGKLNLLMDYIHDHLEKKLGYKKLLQVS